MNKRERWKEEEVSYLRNAIKDNVSYERIAEALGKKLTQVRQKAYFISAGESIEWTESEREYLKSNFMKTDKQIADELNKSVGTVSYQRHKLKLNKISKWTIDEDKLVSDFSVPIREISEKIGRSPASIYMRRFTLGLSKESKRGRNWYNGYKIISKLEEKYGVKESYTRNEIMLV